MKRFLNAFGMTAIVFSLFLPSLSSAQVNYGTRMQKFTVGADYRDGFPHSTTTQEFLTGYAWGGDVAGWLQFNPEISRPFLPPQDFRAIASTTDSITLSWSQENIQPIDDLQLFQGDSNNNFQINPIGRNLQDLDSPRIIVQGLQANTTYKFYLNAKDTNPRGELLAEAYTPVVQATTARDDGGVAEEYQLVCPQDQITTSSIFLQWTGNIPEAHTLTLLGSAVGQALAVIQNPAQQPQGNFTHQELQSATDYQYQLRVTPNAGGEPTNWPAQPIVCRTAPVQGDPEGGIIGLNVTTLGPDSLFLNWTDRSRQNRLYDLRRLRITPDDSTIDSISPLGADSLRLDWTNNTNGFDDRTPFKQTIQRALIGGAFADVSEIRVNQRGNAIVQYNFDDANLTEGTVYQYKIKSCATTLVDLRRGGNLQNNLEICAADSNVFQQATRPNVPDNFTAQVNGQDIILGWSDNSAHEDGYEVNWLRGNVAGNAIILNADTVAHVYNNLEIGQYTFSVRAFKNVGEQKVYSSVANVQAEVSDVQRPQGWLQNNNRSGLTANIYSIMKLAWGNLTEKTGSIFASVFGSIKKAFALQYQNNFEQDYFLAARQVRAPFEPRDFPAVYEDSGLDTGTVYLYRLELLNAANGQHLEGTDVIFGAGETMPDGNGIPVDVKVCTRNNFCGTVQGQRVGNNWPENQCNVNADCRNVGSFYTIIREN
ncbi:MAG: fibronectin type III domain-containing protein [bacterium]|nr:fibronectin type III domain-containing protein [bacterium]